jgi:PPM family protein phosphatase
MSTGSSLPPPPPAVTWAAATDTGRVRAENQDAVFPAGSGEGTPPLLFAVADGLGGEPGGAEASRAAIAGVANLARHPPTAAEVVLAAERSLHHRIREHIVTEPALARMSTTLTVAVIAVDGTLDIGHVGDSRLYVFNSGQLAQVTDDHSVAMDMVRRGEIPLEEAPNHPLWHTISNVLGIEPARIETTTLETQPGDRILLCTDGLTNMVPDPEIVGLLTSHPDDSACVSALIDAANEAGGVDNTTVVVATIHRR